MRGIASLGWEGMYGTRKTLCRAKGSAQARARRRGERSGAAHNFGSRRRRRALASGHYHFSILLRQHYNQALFRVSQLEVQLLSHYLEFCYYRATGIDVF